MSKHANPVAALSLLGPKPRTRPTAHTPNASANVAAAGSNKSDRAIPIIASNDDRNSRTWATENPQYWKQYRHENPDYVGRNRNLQQQRNQKQRSALSANEDVSNPSTQLPSGRYRMARILADGTIGSQTWIVEITPLRVQMDGEDV